MVGVKVVSDINAVASGKYATRTSPNEYATYSTLFIHPSPSNDVYKTYVSTYT